MSTAFSSTLQTPQSSLPHPPAPAAGPLGSTTAASSIWAAWKWENRKSATRWYWLVLALICGVGMFNGASNYLDFRADFDAQGTTWLAVWGQATLLTTMLAFPLLVGSFIAQVCVGEHGGRNWQRMRANHLQETMLRGKLMHMAQIALLTTAVLLGEFLLTGLILGFGLAGIGPFLLRGIPIALAIFATELFVTWLGVYLTSFASIMTLVLLGTVMGTFLVLVIPPLVPYFPLSVITAACSPRDLYGVTSIGSILTTTAIGAVWAGVWMVALRRAIARVA
ncbi:ABC transporter permease [Actinomyces sp.]|uniref:ABC transporter permease n=1 Tax=Actinomyces sp. TaxID=29317 RepID=UPI0026DC96B3|nr:ABC transporter permease [Actinomyces sp.]MDO4900035.1 ABC transporter permease [Actinomyces sp.]